MNIETLLTDRKRNDNRMLSKVTYPDKIVVNSVRLGCHEFKSEKQADEFISEHYHGNMPILEIEVVRPENQ